MTPIKRAGTAPKFFGPKHMPTKFCIVIKLGERKVSTGSTTPQSQGMAMEPRFLCHEC